LELNNIGVRSWLTYLKNARFLSISDLLKSHKAQRKEHTQKIKHFPHCFFIYSSCIEGMIKSIDMPERVENYEYNKKNKNINTLKKIKNKKLNETLYLQV
jgi:hypothetical protein